MYVITYYSFKGGVGRTMALVNIAFSLAREGRKVLIVDFDLEAPGLETFDVLQPPAQSEGVVDFVCSYEATGSTPDVRGYVFERSEYADNGGRLWVMPAGRRDAQYESRLNSIDWARLYAERDGYLLFEDLKAQWQEAFAPDYVFLDSRTGHTDIGGICTRQLPDAVVLVFFPNAQNLLGLRRIVHDIRTEERPSHKLPIELHFVAANVPDLDDEEGILTCRMAEFQKALGYDSPSGVIHYYPSLALLNQAVFSLSRPKSRLAEEYRELQREIVKRNLSDRDGAIAYLRELMTERRQSDGTEARLSAIASSHRMDGEVLFRVGLVEEMRGRLDEAFARFAEAERAGWLTTELLRHRLALVNTLGSNREALQHRAKADALEILERSDVRVQDISSAVSHLRMLDAPAIQNITASPAYRSLSLADRAGLVRTFLFTRDRAIAQSIVADVVDSPGAISQLRKGDYGDFALGLIATGRFREAQELLGPARPTLESKIDRIFNFAMAEWGDRRLPSYDLLTSVAELDARTDSREIPFKQDPNYQQCMVLAYWAAGDIAMARECYGRALQLINGWSVMREIFSCWRYLSVSPDELRDDMRELWRLVEGENVMPAFITGQASD